MRSYVTLVKLLAQLPFLSLLSQECWGVKKAVLKYSWRTEFREEGQLYLIFNQVEIHPGSKLMSHMDQGKWLQKEYLH